MEDYKDYRKAVSNKATGNNFLEEHMTELEIKEIGKLADELGITAETNLVTRIGTIRNKHGDIWVVPEKYIRDISVSEFKKRLREFAESGKEEPGLVKWKDV